MNKASVGEPVDGSFLFCFFGFTKKADVSVKVEG